MSRIMRIRGDTTSVLFTISLLLLLFVPSSARMLANTILDKAVTAYAQTNKMNSNLTNPTAVRITY